MIPSVLGLLLLGNIAVNVVFYVLVKDLYDSDNISDFANAIPEKLKLTRISYEGESVYFDILKFNLPFKKDLFLRVVPHSSDESDEFGSLFLVLKDTDGKTGILIFSWMDSDEVLCEYTIWDRIMHPSYMFKEVRCRTLSEKLALAYYSRLKDFSWWNSYHNEKLVNGLFAKWLKFSHHDEIVNFVFYDLENTYFNGFLIEEDIFTKGEERKYYHYDFFIEKRFYYITYYGPNDEEWSRQVKDMIASIEIIKDPDVAYAEMEAKYNGAVRSELPRELIIIR